MTDEARPTPLESGPLEPLAAVVVYDRETGALFSTHHFSAVDDADLPGRDELERLALELAAGDGCETDRHAVLHVEPKALRRGVGYRVERDVLVELEGEGIFAGVLGR